MPQLTECDMIGHCYNPDDLDPRECGRCHEMEKELMEQAVCNGKGSEREAALESKIAKLRYALCAALPFEDTLFIAGCFNTDLRAVLTRMEKMEEALRFYANAENYFQRMWADECGGISGPSSAMLNDQGQRAKEALE